MIDTTQILNELAAAHGHAQEVVRSALAALDLATQLSGNLSDERDIKMMAEIRSRATRVLSAGNRALDAIIEVSP